MSQSQSFIPSEAELGTILARLALLDDSLLSTILDSARHEQGFLCGGDYCKVKNWVHFVRTLRYASIMRGEDDIIQKNTNKAVN